MRKYISVFIVAALLLSIFAGLGGTALASDILKVTPDKTEMTVGGNVTFSIAITLPTTAAPLTGFMIKCNGSEVYKSPASILNDGSTVEVTDPPVINVPTDKLGTALVFQLCDASGNAIEGATDSVTIAKKELETKINATAAADLTLVKTGDVVTFTINVENQGQTTLENIVVTDPKLNKGKALNDKFSLAPGEKKNVTYQYTVTTAITVQPSVSYTVAGSAAPAQTFKVATPVALSMEDRKVHTSLTIDNSSPQPGEEVKLTLTVSNDGNVPYTDLKVTLGGESMKFPSKTLKGGDSFSQEYPMTFDKSQVVEFIITLKDHKGATIPVKASLNVELPVDQSALTQNVLLSLEPDRQELTSAGTVNFSGRVSNNSDYTISDVKVTEDTLGEVFSLSEMEPGTYQDIEKTADVNGTATYTFTLSFKDKNGQPYTVKMDPVTITVQTLEPSPTDPSQGAAQITLEPTTDKSDPLQIWIIIAIVLLVLIIGVGVAIFVLWKKGKSPSRVTAAKSAAPRPSGQKPKTSSSSFKGGGGHGKPYNGKGKGGFRDRNNF